MPRVRTAGIRPLWRPAPNTTGIAIARTAFEVRMGIRMDARQFAGPPGATVRPVHDSHVGRLLGANTTSKPTGVPPLVLQSRVGQEELIIVDRSPYRVGRKADNHHQIVQPDISGRHSELWYDANGWRLVDCNSTNGTFINGDRLTGEGPVKIGDTIHFATKGYQIIPKSDDSSALNCETALMGNSDEIRDLVGLLEVLNDKRVFPFFQPIIDLASRRTVGWEALGRANTKTGALSPGLLFSMAGQSRVETKLSTQFRDAAVHCADCQHCWPKKSRYYLFINIHPAEIRERKFTEGLDSLAASASSRNFQIVVEMPESWVGNTQEMMGLVKEVRQRDMLVAYDDFGAGQSRIPDLISVPPDFIKLDRSMVSRIDENKVKRSLVKAVVDACRELKVKVLAEGIETADEMNACVDLGVDLAQGFLICRPQPAFQLFRADPVGIPPSCPFVRLELLPSTISNSRPPSVQV